jgi:hypothetical protein
MKNIILLIFFSLFSTHSFSSDADTEGDKSIDQLCPDGYASPSLSIWGPPAIGQSCSETYGWSVGSGQVGGFQEKGGKCQSTIVADNNCYSPDNPNPNPDSGGGDSGGGDSGGGDSGGGDSGGGDSGGGDSGGGGGGGDSGGGDSDGGIPDQDNECGISQIDDGSGCVPIPDNCGYVDGVYKCANSEPPSGCGTYGADGEPLIEGCIEENTNCGWFGAAGFEVYSCFDPEPNIEDPDNPTDPTDSTDSDIDLTKVEVKLDNINNSVKNSDSNNFNKLNSINESINETNNIATSLNETASDTNDVIKDIKVSIDKSSDDNSENLNRVITSTDVINDSINDGFEKLLAECVDGDTRPACKQYEPNYCSDGVTIIDPKWTTDQCPIICPDGSIIRLGGTCDISDEEIEFPEFSFTPSPDATGFYTPEYPDGFSTVWASNESALRSSALVSSIDKWSDLNISGSLDVDFGDFCFDFGFADFGCFKIGIPDYVINFIRAVMLFTCALFCRKLVVGG